MEQLTVEVQYQQIIDLRNAPPNSEGRRPLDELKPAGFNADGMIITVTCGDGDRIEDILGHKRETHRCKLHALCDNGGAMLASEAFPGNSEEWPWGRLLRRSVLDACEVKETNLVALGSHYPCGIAKKHGLSSIDVIRLTVDGRRELKAQKPELEVYCFLHVAHLDGRPRTYTIDHKYAPFSEGGILQKRDRVAGFGGGW